MTKYNESRKVHLSNYKKNILKITDSGQWRNHTYTHILPEDDYELNILKSIRVKFWKYYEGLSGVSLHPGFHHLNSSQAMCFNLFYPLFKNDYSLLSKAIEYIIKESNTPTKINNFNVKSCEFEKILDTNEYTNFDFFVELENGFRVVFETKYTEDGFGSAEKNQNHKNKFSNTYFPKLQNVLLPEKNDVDFVLSNYQLIRNLSYLDDKTFVVFLFPSANSKLKKQVGIIPIILQPGKMENVRIIYLEDFVKQFLSRNDFTDLIPVYSEFEEKYL